MILNKNNYFIYSLLSLGILYLSVAFFLNRYLVIVPDDFWFAHHTLNYKDQLPYRDFSPYKTVLGYYVLLLPMIFYHGLFATLLQVRDFLVVLNSVILISAAIYLSRFFDKKAILMSLLLLLFSETFLLYGKDIRVDLIGYWCCLFSLLALLGKRYFLAGILMGVGFSITQKTLWYIGATNIAYCFYAVVYARNRQSFFSMCQFDSGILFSVGIYLFFWSMIAGWHAVYTTVFLQAAAMYQVEVYRSIQYAQWSNIFFYNSFLFLFWPFGLISLMVSYAEDKRQQQRFFLLTLLACMMTFLLKYNQIFTYYMQIIYPIFLVFYAAFFDWLIGLIKDRGSLSFTYGKLSVGYFVGGYIFLLLLVVTYYGLPIAHFYFLSMLAIFFGLFIWHHSLAPQSSKLLAGLMIISILLIGCFSAKVYFGLRVISLENSYQKANLLAAEKLLQSGGGYVDGINFLYNKKQAIVGLSFLPAPMILYLKNPTKKLREVLLPSLYDANQSIYNILADCKNTALKFYINNYRIRCLPQKILGYLADEYTHLWGSIYFYAPKISAGAQVVRLKFSGNYQVDAGIHHVIMLDKQKLSANKIIFLAKGDHASKAEQSYRLRLMPTDRQSISNTAFSQDDWQKMGSS